jgi:hypothetical protein
MAWLVCNECGGLGFHMVEAGIRGANDPQVCVVQQECDHCLGDGYEPDWEEND